MEKMEMNIESVTRFVSVAVNHSDVHASDRRVAVSVPRVRWLERDPPPPPPPRPLMARDLLPPPPPPSPDLCPTRYTFRPQTRSNTLSERQQQAWSLHCSGLTMGLIGKKMGCSANAAGKLVHQAREKLGVGLGA